jgi:hypothetical protein
MLNNNLFINGGFPLIIPKDIKIVEPKPRHYSNKSIIDINSIINNNKNKNPLINILIPNNSINTEEEQLNSNYSESYTEHLNILSFIDNLHVKPIKEKLSTQIKRVKHSKKTSRKISKKKSK